MYNSTAKSDGPNKRINESKGVTGKESCHRGTNLQWSNEQTILRNKWRNEGSNELMEEWTNIDQTNEGSKETNERNPDWGK